MKRELDTNPERVPPISVKGHAENVRAMIPSVQAVLEAVEEQISNYIRRAPVKGGMQDYLIAHADSVQNLLGVPE